MPDIAQIRADMEERIAFNEDENARLKLGLAAMKQKVIIAQAKPKRKYTKRDPNNQTAKRGPGRPKKLS